MPNKSLGQHWLKDRLILEAVVECAAIGTDDSVLEIGPGLGTLTSVLLARAKEVIAVEFDAELARKLPSQFPGKRLTVHNHDILEFDLRGLPQEYVVVANVPYYITSKIVQVLTSSLNPPKRIVLLVQKEVAERLAAAPGEMSILSVAAQIGYEVSLGPIVGAEWFTPPPKVDSQVVVMNRRAEPLVSVNEQKNFFRVVKAGFSERRKKLRSALSGGLALDKTEVDKLLSQTDLSAEARAQELTIEEWKRLSEAVK